MNRRAVAALIMFAAGPAGQAQTLESLAHEARRAMLAEEPGWRLADDASEDHRFWQRWANGSRRIIISCTRHPSAEAASAWLRALPSQLAMPGEKPLAGVGDEALMWTGLTSSGTTTIVLRKSRYIVEITGPSKTITTRIAGMIAGIVSVRGRWDVSGPRVRLRVCP